MSISYVYAKILKKIRGKALKNVRRDKKRTAVESGSTLVNVSLGKYTYCGYNCSIINANIGSFTSISDNVIIGAAMHPIDWVSTSTVFYQGRDSIKKVFSEYKREPDKVTDIGNDVWIGTNVIIKQGVKIGNGAVIGMGSVVTKDVPDYAIYGGAPAKLIRYRFEQEIIIQLLESKWWDLTDKQLERYAKYIKDPKEFLRNLEKWKYYMFV